MTTKYMIVNVATGEVINSTQLSGQNTWSPPAGHIAVEPTDPNTGIGWTYANGVFSEPVPPVKTLEQTAKEFEVGVQAHLNATAKAAGYDNIYTACTYADEPAVAKFQTEGAALRAWRSNVWAYCYTALTAVQAKTRTVPTLAELIAELPTAPK